jgi:ABC-type polysaccharide/polyol phosphate export permease
MATADAPSARAAKVVEGRHLRWVENRPAAGWLPRLDAAELWAYRELALVFAAKDLRVRYKQTFLGVAWALLQPLVAALLFTVVFGRLAGLRADLPYVVFAYAGMVVWLQFSSSLTTAAESLVGNRDLVTKVYFPRLLAPLAALVPPLVDLALGLVVLGIFLAGYGVFGGLAVLLAPAWVVLGCIAALGAGLGLSALNVRYRDVRHVLPFLLQIWFFATPIAYPSSLVEGGWRYVYAINPMAGVVDGFRWSVAGGVAPGAEVAISAGVAFASLLVGFLYFRHVERSFADVI